MLRGWNRGMVLQLGGQYLAALMLVLLLLGQGVSWAADDDFDDLFADDDYLEDEVQVSDPLEPMNRFFFAFNDKMYFWLLHPIAQAYSVVLPEDIRFCVDNGFHNIGMPVRLVNNLLQGKVKGAGVEISRFFINTTLGAAGLGDPAATEFGMARNDEDFGQTLGGYGLGEGIYLCLPFFGPSSARDGVGLAGDYLVTPLRYFLNNNTALGFGLWGWRIENSASLHGKDYEDLSEQAFDSYVAFRDFYLQHRRALVNDIFQAKGADVEKKDSVILDCEGQEPRDPVFNLFVARHIMACAEQQGKQVSLTSRRHGNRMVYGVVVD